MTIFRSPLTGAWSSPLNGPLGVGVYGTGTPSLSKLVFLFNRGVTDDTGLSSAVLAWSASGPVADGYGGLTEDFPLHPEGAWLGPSYTRSVGQPTPDGYPEIPEGATSASMAGSSGNNGLFIDMDAPLLECYRGAPDGVELLDDTGWSVDPTIVRDGLTFTLLFDGVTAYASKTISFPVGNRYLFRYTVLEYTAGAGRSWGLSSTGFTTNTEYLQSTLGSGELAVESDGTNLLRVFMSGVQSSGQLVVRLDSIQKLLPQPMTAIIGVTMGVDSADVTTPLNVVTASDTIAGLLYLDSGGTIKVTDGTNTASVTIAGGYSTLDEIYGVAQVADDGLTMRVGYLKNDETAVTFGSSVPYVGTFGPGTHLRASFDGDKPQWNNGIAQYNVALDDADIMRVIKVLKK